MPERPRRVRGKQERGHGVDRDRPEHRDDDEREIHPEIRLFAAVTVVEEIKRDHEVEQRVAAQHDDVPGQERRRPVEAADVRDHVPEPVRPSEIGDHEHDGHRDGGDRHALADEDDVLDVLAVKDIGRDHEQHGRRRDADEEREVGDVEAPRHLVAHAGHDETVRELLRVIPGADRDDERERTEPQPVFARAAEHLAAAVDDEANDRHDPIQSL